MEATRIITEARRRLRSGSARACHSEPPTLMRSLLMSRKNTLRQAAQAALHRTLIIAANGGGPATSTFDITWPSATFMSCLSAKVAVTLLLAHYHTFSAGGVSAARVVFELGDHSLYVPVIMMQPWLVRVAVALSAPSPIASGTGAFQETNKQ